MTHDVSMDALVLMLMGGEEAVKERLTQNTEELQRLVSQLPKKEPDEVILKLKEENMRILKEQGAKFVTEEEARRIYNPFEGLF